MDQLKPIAPQLFKSWEHNKSSFLPQQLGLIQYYLPSHSLPLTGNRLPEKMNMNHHELRHEKTRLWGF